MPWWYSIVSGMVFVTVLIVIDEKRKKTKELNKTICEGEKK